MYKIAPLPVFSHSSRRKARRKGVPTAHSLLRFDKCPGEFRAGTQLTVTFKEFGERGIAHAM